MKVHWPTECIPVCYKLINVITEQKATIHQVTTMLATSKNVLFPGHNHLLINTGTVWPDTLIITLAGTWAMIKVSSHQYRWLAGGYNLEVGHTFLEVAGVVVTWWIVAFLSCLLCNNSLAFYLSFHQLSISNCRMDTDEKTRMTLLDLQWEPNP